MSYRHRRPPPAVSPTTHDEPRAARWAWYTAFLVLVFLVGCVEIEDPDIWWHLRTGQLIWQRGSVPRSDWFTYTNPDSPWIDLHWGFQLLAGALWAVGGAPALVVCKSLFAVATFALAMLGSRRGWPAWQTVACWLPSLLIFSGRNQVRPEMFSLLFLAAELAVLYHAPQRPRLVWLLPAIQIAWINTHALYVLGLVLWACFFCGQLIGRAWQRTGNSRVPMSHWSVVTAAMLLAALVNPYGVDGALFPLTLIQRIEGPDHAFYTQFSGEFRGLGEFIAAYGIAAVFQNLTTAMLVLLFVVTIFSFLILIARGGRIDLYRMAIFALFSWLAWKANRNGVLFALVSGTVLRANLGEWLQGRTMDASRFRWGPVVTAAIVGVLIIGVPFGLLAMLRPAEIPRWFGVSEIPNAFPHDAARFLGRKGMPARCYAVDEGAAAVYIFHNAPERLVFADARLEVNTRQTLERYLTIERQIIEGDARVYDNLVQGIPLNADGNIEMPALLIFSRYLATNPGLQRGLSNLKRYRRVYVDNVAVVFIEQTLAEKLGLGVLQPAPAEGE